MKRTASVILAIFSFVYVASAELEVSIKEQPDWKQPTLSKAQFLAEIKENKELLGADADDGDGFIVFSCTAEENLKKRILWIDVELTFSNDFTRKFEGISFMILEKGTEYDIRKVPFDRSLLSSNEENKNLEVTKMHITSIALK